MKPNAFKVSVKMLLHDTIDKKTLEQLRQEGSKILSDVETIIQCHGPSLLAYASKLAPDQCIVDDMIQLTWTTLYLDGIRYGRDWLYAPERYSWLKQVLKHIAYDIRCERSRFLTLDTQEGLYLLEALTSHAESPEDILLHSEVKMIIYDTIHDMPPKQQASIRLFYYHNSSIDDIACILGCPKGTVKSYLTRGRRRLRQLLLARGIDTSEIVSGQGTNLGGDTDFIDVEINIATNIAIEVEYLKQEGKYIRGQNIDDKIQEITEEMKALEVDIAEHCYLRRNELPSEEEIDHDHDHWLHIHATFSRKIIKEVFE